MPLAALAGYLLDLAVWGLALAALLPCLPLVAPRALALMLAAARVVAVASSIALAAVGALGLAGIAATPLEWWPGLPGDPFRLAPDALAAPFLLLLGVLGVLSFGSASYAHGPATAGRRATFALHAGFALALAAAFAASHALLFLIAWEGMTLLSAALVAHDVRSARARSAAWVYLSLSHVGTALMAFGLMRLVGISGSFGFADLSRALALLPPGEAHVAVWLMSAGFAVKLGLVPFHVWLPLAHPEAPGPVSALLSGVMVKAGLYGLLRFGWAIPGAPPPGWGEILTLLGMATALIGALYAVVESDAKRLLAYSTIKHAGLMSLSLGLAATLFRGGQTALAGVALAAVFYHAIGHGFAKGLAFLSVAEAAHAAGSRDLERLGGLARRLPRLSIVTLVSVLALCGLPLLSCFAGEWLTFQALILGYSAGEGSLRLIAPFAGASLALATALAGAALIKLYGIGFLGRPRTAEAAAATPAPAPVELAFLGGAVLIAAWGLGASWAVTALSRPVSAVLLAPFDTRTMLGAGGLTLTIPPHAFASISPVSVAVLLALFCGLAFAWGTARGLRRAVRRAPSWSCGVALTPRMQYSALGYTKPLRLIFQPLLRSERELEQLEPGSPYFAQRLRVKIGVPELTEKLIYQPLVQGVLWTSEQARRLQSGNLNLYLAYLLATLVVLLLVAR